MFERQPILYTLDSLEPFIDARTMNEHFNVHYKKYTDVFNQQLDKDGITTDGSIESAKRILKYTNNIKIINNGGGYYNHLLYFENISPFRNTYETSSDDLKNLINYRFGSYENFKNNFIKAGLDVFGSGWVWLIYQNGILNIATTKNQNNPIMNMDCEVLLGMDVWEHAYYLKHLADRKSYMEDFFRVIDWEVVSSRLNVWQDFLI
jgi:Fe-Mn family superoxide dismutase